MQVRSSIAAAVLASAMILPAAAPALAAQHQSPRPQGIEKKDTLRWVAPQDLKIGTAVAGGGHHETQPYPAPFTFDQEYRQHLAAEFSSVSPENQLKWEFVHPERGTYRFAEMDAIVKFATGSPFCV